MNNGMEFTIKNDKTSEVLSATKTQKRKALYAMGACVEGHVKKDGNCPVDTGRLRNSFAHQEDQDATFIGSNVEYAKFQEFGTSRGIKAHHMLKYAVENHTDELKRITEAALKS